MIQTIKTESLVKEKSNQFTNLTSDFVNSTNNKTGFSIKSFFDPAVSWESILNLIYDNSKIKNEQLENDVVNNNSTIKEQVTGNVLIVDDLYFSIQLKDGNNFTPPEIIDICEGISTRNGFGAGAGVLKVSIGSRFVIPHEDKWGAMVFQLTGQAVWTLSYPETKYEESFILNPGDFLYFPKGMLHSIVSNSARSSIITPVGIVL